MKIQVFVQIIHTYPLYLNYITRPYTPINLQITINIFIIKLNS